MSDAAFHEFHTADNTLEVRHLRTRFFTREGELPAVEDVSLTLARGRVLGLVGESGSGKSVTGFSIMGLIDAPGRVVGGEILFKGKNLVGLPEADMRRLRGSRIAMVFQDPMSTLNPVQRVDAQMIEAVRAHRDVSRSAAREQASEALAAMGIASPDERLRAYPHQLSGGMRQRVAIAIAMLHKPDLIIADEPTTALDVTIQAQILDLLAELRSRFGLAMLFISHDLAVVSRVADRVAVMYAGSLVELGTRQEIFRSPAHPYTRGLLHAVPDLKTDRGHPLETIEGTVPPLHAMPLGCSFEPRCEFRIPECARVLPPLVEVGEGHWARCPVVNSK
jgi:peptide/nickel transport system ATP-binding protein